MVSAGFVRQHGLERCLVDRSVPDPVVAPTTWLKRVILARNRVPDNLVVRRQKERELVEDRVSCGLRHGALVRDTAPDHIAGVNRLDLRYIYFAHRRAVTVRRDE